jgi:hypothetical protein
MSRSKALKEAQQRYRENNKELCNSINAKSNRKIYNANKELHLERAKQHYYNNRNYKGDITNVGKALSELFRL